MTFLFMYIFCLFPTLAPFNIFLPIPFLFTNEISFAFMYLFKISGSHIQKKITNTYLSDSSYSYFYSLVLPLYIFLHLTICPISLEIGFVTYDFCEVDYFNIFSFYLLPVFYSNFWVEGHRTGLVFLEFWHILFQYGKSNQLCLTNSLSLVSLG